MQKKIAIILTGIIVLAAGIFLTVHFLSKKTDSYRSILIYQLEGKAEIEREGAGTITAANNLYLESGDKVRLDSGSSMRLRLDDDKYIMVEENSVLSIQAEGSDQDSKTTINLEQGAITNEIQNKLTEQSAYEVNSPNSIMAVRGTIFRAEGYTDQNGVKQTKISTFNGTVGFQPIAPDGTKQEEVLIEAGKEAVVQSTSDGVQYLKEPSGISFSELPLQALHFLQDLLENGARITCLSLDDLQKLIRESENKNETNSDPQSSSAPQANSDPQASSEDREPAGQDSTPDPDSSNPESTDNESDSDSGQQSPDNDTPSGQDSPKKTPSGQEADKKENKTYTVTFKYKGTTFGVQTVKDGHTASEPKLSPESKGKWNFDFSQKINKNIVINWITE